MTNIPRIIEQVYYKPWLIQASGWDTVHALIQSKLGDTLAARPESDFFGDSLPKMRIEARTAIIPVYGVIGHKLGMLEKSCGATGVEDIEEDMVSAAGNRKIDRIILDIDSPGGTVGGVAELGDLIADINANDKQVIVFSDSLIASAAYWLAAGAHSIITTKCAESGSIGVFSALTDRSEAFRMEGLKVEVIRSGPKKGLGIPGTPITDALREEVQRGVDQIYGLFSKHVKQYRPRVTDDSMQGQVFLAQEAAGRGLVDGIVTSIADLIR
jgi:signal peptide peptidase SppA